MSVALSVNLNKIALLRNSRSGNFPDVIAFGRQCLALGVQGLTVHPRPDQRHIRPEDVRAISALVKQFPSTEFNIEGNPFAAARGTYPGLMALVAETHPEQCTLVPDTNAQLTSDHGFDLTVDGERLAPIIREMQNQGVRVSLFMDPVKEQISLAKDIGADRIELYTGPYAEEFAHQADTLSASFERYAEAALHAQSLGLGINAGHDLSLENLPQFIQIPHLQEVSIGHALTVDALNMGFANAVKAYLAICQKPV